MGASQQLQSMLFNMLQQSGGGMLPPPTRQFQGAGFTAPQGVQGVTGSRPKTPQIMATGTGSGGISQHALNFPPAPGAPGSSGDSSMQRAALSALTSMLMGQEERQHDMSLADRRHQGNVELQKLQDLAAGRREATREAGLTKRHTETLDESKRQHDDTIARQAARDREAARRYRSDRRYQRGRDRREDLERNRDRQERRQYRQEDRQDRRDRWAEEDKRWAEQFGYTKTRDEAGDRERQEERQYRRGRDEVADKRYEQREATEEARYQDEASRWERQFGEGKRRSDRDFGESRRRYEQDYARGTEDRLEASRRYLDERDFQREKYERDHNYQKLRDETLDERYRREATFRERMAEDGQALEWKKFESHESYRLWQQDHGERVLDAEEANRSAILALRNQEHALNTEDSLARRRLLGAQYDAAMYDLGEAKDPESMTNRLREAQLGAAEGKAKRDAEAAFDERMARQVDMALYTNDMEMLDGAAREMAARMPGVDAAQVRKYLLSRNESVEAEKLRPLRVFAAQSIPAVVELSRVAVEDDAGVRESLRELRTIFTQVELAGMEYGVLGEQEAKRQMGMLVATYLRGLDPGNEYDSKIARALAQEHRLLSQEGAGAQDVGRALAPHVLGEIEGGAESGVGVMDVISWLTNPMGQAAVAPFATAGSVPPVPGSSNPSQAGSRAYGDAVEALMSQQRR